MAAGNCNPFANGDCRLLIAAVHGVFAFSAAGLVELLPSKSKGIAAARWTRSDSDVVAVADSQVIALHSASRGMDGSHRFRNSGPPRQLWYDKRNDRLLFTTKLETAVQIYSLRMQRLIAPAVAHPKPPNLFAVHTSADLNVVLSASAKPSTIQITMLKGNSTRASCVVAPPCSDSACSAAAFHPVAGPVPGTVIFVLGFTDGTVAAYSFNPIPLEANLPGAWEELASVKGAHVTTTKTALPKASRLRQPKALKSPTTSHVKNEPVEIGEFSMAVTAVALFRGHICLAVTIGSDGRCCVTDFEPEAGPRILKRWSLHGSATALAVHQDAIAVGMEIGKVSIFDVDGNILFTQELDGNRIVDLEWISCVFDRGHLTSKLGYASYEGDFREPLQTKTNAEVIGVSPGAKFGAPNSFEKSPSWISARRESLYDPETPRQLKSPSSPASQSRSKTNSHHPPRLQQQESNLESDTAEDHFSAWRRPTSRTLRSVHPRANLPTKRQLSTSSSGTVKRVSQQGLGTGSQPKGTDLPQESKVSATDRIQERKHRASVRRKEPPKIPPRPTKSPGKLAKDQEKPSKQEVALSRVERKSLPTALPGAFDGNKDRANKKKTFIETTARNSQGQGRRHSMSSSLYSDDYEIEWNVSPDARGVSRSRLTGDRRFFPLRQPEDALDDSTPSAKPLTPIEVEQPVLKAPFPAARRGPLPDESGLPCTPQHANFDKPPLPSAVSASKHHSEAKKARKESSPRRQGVGSPTPTRRPRKDHSVVLELLDKSPSRPAPAVSSSGTSSYATALTQTDASSADLTQEMLQREMKDRIRDEIHRFRETINHVLDEHESHVLSMIASSMR